uniref:Gag-pol polyprotein n=1 Tax=Solanum tuberosum TaxID=4113 RepID=M1DFM0_SOLTU
MYVADTERVELAAYQLKNVARTWFDQWKEGRVEGAPPGNRAQSSSVAPPDRAAPRGATSGTDGGANSLYAITSRHEQENSPDVVDGELGQENEEGKSRAGFGMQVRVTYLLPK